MSMKCAEVMISEMEHCSIDEPVESVLRRLRAAKASFFAVCDAAGALVGAVSEREMSADSARTRSRDDATTFAAKIEAIMSNDLVCCAPDDDVDVACELMNRFGKSRVVCVDGSLRPVGFISGRELLHVNAYRSRQARTTVS